MLAPSKVKVRRSVKKSEQEHVQHSLHKSGVTRHDSQRRLLSQHSIALQHWFDIVSNGYNIVPALPRCFALKIVVANRSV